jgi:organic radical activating enzyme
VHIETSGVHPLSGSLDWVTFSPKRFKAPLAAAYAAADELKVVVHSRADLSWAEEHAAHVRADCELFLQPQWFKPETAGWILAYIKANPHWRLSMQTHKYLDIP